MSNDLKTLIEKTRPIFEKYGFRKVGIFGSRARGDFHQNSDADFLFSDTGHTLDFSKKLEAEAELEQVLGVSVDLVPDTRVIARMRSSIRKDLKIIYERQ